MNRGGNTRDRFFNDHVDRVSALIKDKDGKRRLLVGSPIETGQSVGQDWVERDTLATLELLAEQCERHGVILDCIEDLTIPYSLNFPQFPDGRVLITSEEPVLAEHLTNVLGEGMVQELAFPDALHSGLQTGRDPLSPF